MRWILRLFSFKGRIGRRTLFHIDMCCLGFLFALSILASIFPDAPSKLPELHGLLEVALVILLLIIWPVLPTWISTAAHVKRAHDVGVSGFRWWLISLIPIFGWLYSFTFYFRRGDPLPNNYGDTENPD